MAKMSLESHSAEAKVLLAAFLTSALTRPNTGILLLYHKIILPAFVVCVIWHAKSWTMSWKLSVQWKRGARSFTSKALFLTNTCGNPIILVACLPLNQTKAFMPHWLQGCSRCTLLENLMVKLYCHPLANKSESPLCRCWLTRTMLIKLHSKHLPELL